MRRTIFLMASGLLTLTACGGAGGISAADLAKQQDAADDVARTVVAALVEDLQASPPSADTLGRGLYAGCDGGDPDQAAYFVDTFVTYGVRPAAQASDEVLAALKTAGLETSGVSMTNSAMLRSGDVTVDLSSQDKGGGSAGQNIFVSTGCLAIGKDAIAAFNAENGRAVTP